MRYRARAPVDGKDIAMMRSDAVEGKGEAGARVCVCMCVCVCVRWQDAEEKKKECIEYKEQ